MLVSLTILLTRIVLPLAFATDDTEINSTEVQNPRCKLDDVFMLIICVFGSVLACAKSAHVFQTHFADFVSNNSSSDSKAFLHFIAFSGSPTAVFVDCSCTMVLHCGHTFLNRP